MTTKQKENLSIAHLGQVSWSKGTKGVVKPNSGSFKKGINMGYGFKKGYHNPTKGTGTQLKTLSCIRCGNPFTAFPCEIKLGKRFCSKNCTKNMLGKKRTKESIEKMIFTKISNNTIPKGKNHYKYLEDRTLLKTAIGSEERRSSIYKEWRRRICNRDNWKCKINNQECKGRLEVHHILGFTQFPELKYDINNGICLCHFHHPRVREEEKRLIPVFQVLVSVSKENFEL